MKYISTRGECEGLGFNDVLLAGLARDGGLYVPESWPEFTGADIHALAGLSYQDVAYRIMSPFIGRDVPETNF